MSYELSTLHYKLFIIFLWLNKVLIQKERLFLLVSVFIITSCGGKQNADDTEYFLSNRSEIGIELVDQELGLKFNPPKNWELTPSSLSRKIENKINQNDSFIYEPVYLFFNNKTRAILSVGKIVASDSLLSGSAKLNFYKNYLVSKYKDANLSVGNFSIEDVQLSQVRYEKENLIAYKIFFLNSRKEIIQLEYSVQKDALNSCLIAIKSSIGTIRTIK